MKNYFKRFKNFNVSTWIIIVSMFIMVVVGLHFTISMSVKIAAGLTLFGDSNNSKNELETVGPTNADISVLVLFWIVTILLTALFIYYLFFKKVQIKSDEVKKEHVVEISNEDDLKNKIKEKQDGK